MGLDDDTELVVKKRPAQLLITLRREEESYANELSQKTGCTYSHTTKTLKKMEEKDLLRKYGGNGRKNKLEITEKGAEIADRLIEIDNQFKGLML